MVNCVALYGACVFALVASKKRETKITFYMCPGICYLCSQHLMKVYHDYLDNVPTKRIRSNYFLGAFQANKQKGQKLNINIGVTDKKRCD